MKKPYIDQLGRYAYRKGYACGSGWMMDLQLKKIGRELEKTILIKSLRKLVDALEKLL